MLRHRLLAALSLAVALAAAPAVAIPITPSGFGAAQVVESFEAIALGPNIRIGMGVSLLEPGTVSAYTFASGVVLTSPIPIPGVLNRGAFVHDLARGTDVQNNWGSTGVVNDPTDVPFGDAYLGAFHPAVGTATVRFSFTTPVDRVGAYVTGVAGSTITMRAYDASGALLETATIGSTPLASWATNFVGIQQLGRISRLEFQGADFGLDALTFEDDPLLVPEPATLHHLAVGLLGLWGLAALGRGAGGARRPARVRVRR
jgi:hypothetical protein